MEYPDEIVLEGEDLQFWKRHSAVIADLAGNDDELTMEKGFFDMINPGSELVDENVYPPESSELYWMMFVDLAQGMNKVGAFDSAGLAQLNTRKGYTKKRLMRLLDYLGFKTNKTSIEALKSYMRSHQINSARETVPRGIGVHKAPAPTPYKYRIPRYNYNENNDYDYNYLKYIENQKENNSKNEPPTNNNYYSNGEDSLQRLLATLPTKYVPHSKTAKERKRRHRKHSRMTKRMLPKNLRKPKKNRRNGKTTTRKYNKDKNNNNAFEAINYFKNNNDSAFSFDD